MKNIQSKNFSVVALSVTLFALSVVLVQAAPGDLDLTFGAGGKVMTQTGYDEKGSAIAIQSDGKIVGAGTRVDDNAEDGLLARYNTDGSLDQSFGIGGFVIDAAHGGHKTFFTAVAIQTDGKIVATGYFFEAGGCTGTRPWVVRYNTDGSRDTTFGVNGTVEYYYYCEPAGDSYGYNYGIAIQNDGKIVVVGSSKNAANNLDFAAARLNTDGSLDTSFNLDGLAMFPIGSIDEVAYSVAVHPNGRIVLAGYSYSSAASNNFAVVMLNSQGLYDWNFGGTGKVTTDTGGADCATAVAFQSDGKILAAGGRQSSGAIGIDFSLVRYNTNGSLDTSFSTDGKVVTAFGSTYDMAFGIALQPNGKAVAAGRGEDANAPFTGYNFALSRYQTNGKLDIAFSDDGKQMTDFSNYQDEGRAVVIQADGKIVVAGYSWNGSNDNDIVLARYLP